jgi:hypothetical protein
MISSRTILSAGLLAVGLLVLMPSGSRAAMLSARDLVADCSGDAVAVATCDGYLMAVTDYVLQRESRGREGGKVCVPETVTVGQVRDAVLNVAHRQAGNRADSPDGPGGEGRGALRAPNGLRLVARAMRVTWPCDTAPNRP